MTETQEAVERLTAQHANSSTNYSRDIMRVLASNEKLVGALTTFAIMANEDTDYLPDEHVISLTYDDTALDDDLGGPNTLLGERFMRAFRAARQALRDAGVML